MRELILRQAGNPLYFASVVTFTVLNKMKIWEKISIFASIGGVITSLFSLWVASEGMRSATRISTEALETSRQANSIALGLTREPAIIEFSDSGNDKFTFDFLAPRVLSGDLTHYVSIKNSGKKSVDAIAIEIIGIDGLTYRLSPPLLEVRSLPATSARLDLRSALQPEGAIHVDIRKLVLLYLRELRPLLPKEEAEYNTVVNVVLAPKSTNEATPAGAGTANTTHDRRLLTIRFAPSLLDTTEAKQILLTEVIPHRLFDR